MFDYGGERRLDSVETRAYPLEQEKQWLPGPEGSRLMSPKEGRSVLTTEDLRVRREEGGRIAIPAELSSGEYVLEVLVRVPEGDASYYFRVAVEGDRASALLAPAISGTEPVNFREPIRPVEKVTTGSIDGPVGPEMPKIRVLVLNLG